MTEPDQPQRFADRLIDASAAAALLAWERWVTAQVDAAVDQAIAEAGPTEAALRSAARTVTGVIGRAAAAAYGVGRAIAASAFEVLAGRRARTPRRAPRPAPPSARPVDVVTVTAIRRLEEGADPVAVVHDARAGWRATGATLVNQSASAGSAAAAAQLGAQGLIWVAERTACTTCIILSGEVVALGTGFSADLTLGDRPARWQYYDGEPPRHPWCRCRTVPFFGEQDRAAAEALKREARRSVLRGWSLPSESEPARLRAAERLLRQGSGLPVSVERYAREAIRLGRFPRGRALPTTPSRS